MKFKITPSQIVMVVLASVGSVLVAHYDTLLPYHWKTYTPPDGTFSIELPGKPTVEATPVPLEGGGTATINIVTVRPTSHTSYGCTYVDRQAGDRRSPELVLEATRDGSLSKIQGTVLSQKQITFQGFPAMDVQATARGDSLFDERLVVTVGRVYALIAVATVKGDREPKTVHRVYDSFRIIQNHK